MAKNDYDAKTGGLKVVKAEVKVAEASSEEKSTPKEQPAVVKDSAYYDRLVLKYQATADKLRKEEEAAAKKEATEAAEVAREAFEKKLADSEAARVAIEKEANEAKSKIAELSAKIRDDEKKITSLGAELSVARKKVATLEADNEKLALAMAEAEDRASKAELAERVAEEKAIRTAAAEAAIPKLVETTEELIAETRELEAVLFNLYDRAAKLGPQVEKLALEVKRI